MKARWWFGLALVFALVSLSLLVWGFWPPRRETATVPLILPAGMPSLPEERTIRLTFSPRMRAGDSQIVELNVTSEGNPTDGGVYDAYNVIAEARLDLALADVRPADTVSAALVEGGGATFYWEVNPREEGALRGTVWVYLRFVPKAGGEEARQPVSAQLMEVRSQSLLGRSGTEARGIGVVGAVLGLIALLWGIRVKRL
ncbi:MAG: hypothetical protein ACOYZ6_04810 [Chloroflexota bacterium]